MAKVYMGDAGTELTMNVGTDIADATVLKIKYKKPDGGYGEWIASLQSRTSLSYTTRSTDFDVKGDWKLQAYVETPSWSGLGTTAILIVAEPFE